MARPLVYSIFNWVNKKRVKRSMNRIFAGVYKTIRDVPVINEGYNNKKWLENIYSQTILKINSIRKAKFIIDAAQRNNITNLLPLLTSISAQNHGKTSILDFGGGMGEGYVECLKCLSNTDCFFHVVDTHSNNEFAKKIFLSDSRIEFYDIDIPDDLLKVNIVNIGSSLQYVDDYKSILSTLIKKKPEYIFFSDTFMGEMPTFATMQVNMKGKGIPC